MKLLEMYLWQIYRLSSRISLRIEASLGIPAKFLHINVLLLCCVGMVLPWQLQAEYSQ